MKTKKLGKVEYTARGFEFIDFKDRYGMPCELQQSSLADCEVPGTSAVWLGEPEHRMHLDRERVEALIGHLQRWLETGSLK